MKNLITTALLCPSLLPATLMNAFYHPYQSSFSARLTSIGFTSTVSKSSVRMAVTPIGPFCPFRSKASIDVEPSMKNLNTATPNFATEMARLQLDMQIGNAPDPQRLKDVADGIEQAVQDWERLLGCMNESPDFQTKEYFKLTQAHLSSHDQSPDEVATMMKWQANCMRAMANNTPPPLPPPTINLEKMMEEAKAATAPMNNEEGKKRRSPGLTAMANAEAITAVPFSPDSPLFDSENVREEYEALCRDHNSLIEMGGSYAKFDAMGKIAYLNQVESIEERWDVFFTRFSLMGMVNTAFVKQCDAFLDSMGLDEVEFRNLLKKAHQMMREDAEKERNFIS